MGTGAHRLANEYVSISYVYVGARLTKTLNAKKMSNDAPEIYPEA